AASAAQTTILSNNNAATLSISSIATIGDYAQTNTYGTSLAPSSSCTISVTFTPTTTGTRTGTLSITDDAAGSPQTLSLSGTGVLTYPGTFTYPYHNDNAWTGSEPQ